MKHIATVVLFVLLGCSSSDPEVQTSQPIGQKPFPACQSGDTCTMNDGSTGTCVLGVCATPCGDALDCPYVGDCRDASCLLGGCFFTGAPDGRSCENQAGVCMHGSCAQYPNAPIDCATSDDCFFSMCTDSECIDGKCVHVPREDGLLCIDAIAPGYPPNGGHYGGTCDAGRCKL